MNSILNSSLGKARSPYSPGLPSPDSNLALAMFKSDENLISSSCPITFCPFPLIFSLIPFLFSRFAPTWAWSRLVDSNSLPLIPLASNLTRSAFSPFSEVIRLASCFGLWMYLAPPWFCLRLSPVFPVTHSPLGTLASSWWVHRPWVF